jgi:diguanylate cyclase (GGDEF)-like protein
MTSSPAIDAFQEQFRTLQQQYLQQLQHKLDDIQALRDQLRESPWQPEVATTLHRMTHGLAGSGATFGLTGLSAAARNLELFLATLNEAMQPPTDDQQRQIDALLNMIRQATITPQPASAPYRPFEQATLVEQEDRLVFVVESDPRLADDLAVQIGHFGYAVRSFTTLADFRTAAVQTRPAAAILDASFTEGAGVATLAALQQTQSIPLIFTAQQQELAARLRAVRAGGAAYYSKPINVGSLIDMLDTLTNQRAPEPYRILIVEDDPTLAAYYATTLRHAEMSTMVVNNPIQVMQPLEEFHPDLILMDMYMPDCTGLELAAVIRQQEAFVSVPIVYLSAETNITKQQTAMRLGGDDFLTKPIQPDHLVSSITSRVQRSRKLRSFMIRDSLTGLLNHTRTQEQLDLAVMRARRSASMLTFAMIDIDHFKAVNDTHGHPVGDRVIKSLARLLQQRLRRTDIIGRYGGEEFAVALLDVDGPTAIKIMNELRSNFEQIRHRGDDTDFYVTFSCGIASLSHYQEAAQLVNAADRALYQAKRAGRNRVVYANERYY